MKNFPTPVFQLTKRESLTFMPLRQINVPIGTQSPVPPRIIAGSHPVPRASVLFGFVR